MSQQILESVKSKYGAVAESSQKDTLSKWGVTFRAHSDANLFSMWTHYEYRLIPKSAGSDSPNYVGLGAEFIFNMRADNRRGIDVHCAYQPNESVWKRVRRLNNATIRIPFTVG